MTTDKVAARYSRALFEIAQEEGQISPYGAILHEVAAQIEGNEELREFLLSPHAPQKAKKEVLGEVFAGIPELLQNFLSLLVDKGREEIISQIAKVYQEIVDEESQAFEVSVTSAKKMKPEEESALIKKLEETSGRTIRLITQEDPSLIGGLTIHIGNRWIDGSIKGRLAALSQALAKPVQKQMEVEG